MFMRVERGSFGEGFLTSNKTAFLPLYACFGTKGSPTRCYPVSTRLNQVQKVDAECCAPVAVVQSQARLF
jgi:hypothetical protein